MPDISNLLPSLFLETRAPQWCCTISFLCRTCTLEFVPVGVLWINFAGHLKGVLWNNFAGHLSKGFSHLSCMQLIFLVMQLFCDLIHYTCLAGKTLGKIRSVRSITILWKHKIVFIARHLLGIKAGSTNIVPWKSISVRVLLKTIHMHLHHWIWSWLLNTCLNCMGWRTKISVYNECRKLHRIQMKITGVGCGVTSFA